ncbi:hypothetical protein P5637_07260 [Bacillus paralicheniformis]|uniref:Uncharacterized protein n=2 Tax=Bacillus paralicheniformis TaxID=1648923 RepID=A0ABY3FWJ5_9BACI|nr:hypothetical protein [Bacillus paralicheniformis]TWL39518.1 hypothetical protein CHCC15381_4084 [Bacillus paralicheniformis]WEZ25572.1 hypothetical protein P5637_07260 [Bacillus paralicheniformis]
MYSKRVGDPSSKYGLNPNQFEIDIMNKQRKTQELKEHYKESLYELIKVNAVGYEIFPDDKFSLILECLREIKDELKIN